MNQNVRVEVLFQIRDSRGLDAKEKAFLFVTETRGIMFSKWHTARGDMGLSKRGYYDARASLLEKGLLLEERNYNSTTAYTVNAEAFPYGEQDSHPGNDHSRSGNGDSRSDETKETTKVTHEEHLEGNQSTNADAPADASSPNYEVREESQDVKPPLTGISLGRGVDAPSVYTTEDELRERRERMLNRANTTKEKVST